MAFENGVGYDTTILNVYFLLFALSLKNAHSEISTLTFFFFVRVHPYKYDWRRGRVIFGFIIMTIRYEIIEYYNYNIIIIII